MSFERLITITSLPMLPGYEKDSLGCRGFVNKLDLCGEYRSSSSDYDRSVYTHDRFVISKFDGNGQHRTDRIKMARLYFLSHRFNSVFNV